ncbi:hypothetical protein AX16_000221 [Volvariella volvacea WC 439]|nr:hypothetical protein AX16_000221 [Volvariella volvacea WC 439]
MQTRTTSYARQSLLNCCHAIRLRYSRMEQCKSIISPSVVMFTRGVRNKRGTGFYNDPLRRDERLLRRLEAQLESVKTKIKREEEEEAAQLCSLQSQQGSRAGDTSEGHSLYLWEKVLTSEDRKELAMNGIHSLGQLYGVYQEADAMLSKPPHPKPEKLPPRLRFAHRMYTSIPEKLSQAGRQKAQKTWFGGWF